MTLLVFRNLPITVTFLIPKVQINYIFLTSLQQPVLCLPMTDCCREVALSLQDFFVVFFFRQAFFTTFNFRKSTFGRLEVKFDSILLQIWEMLKKKIFKMKVAVAILDY